MSDHQSSPLLAPAPDSREHRPRSSRSNRSGASNASTETTPLLSRDDELPHDGEGTVTSSPAASSLRSIQGRPPHKHRTGRRWPTLVALVLLGAVFITIMVMGFFAPAIIREYATEAMVVEPTNLSIDSFTSNGVRARVQLKVQLDASRVRNSAVRNLGRAGTWIVKEIECGQSDVAVYVPEYGNVLLGVATVPRIVLNIRNGHQNRIDLLTDLVPGEISGIRTIANDWLEGRLAGLRVQGKATLGLKSGIFSLGTQTISESFAFEGHDLPAIPGHDITRLVVRDTGIPGRDGGLMVEASVAVENTLPIELKLPSLGFDLLMPNCSPNDPPIFLGNATTRAFEIHPGSEFKVDADGIVRQLPDTITTRCPHTHSSPLDLFLSGYLHGEDTTVYIRGSTYQPAETPGWIAELLSAVTVPFPVPGRSFDNLMKNFSLADVHCSLPDPLAAPNTPAAQPRLSAVAKVLIAVPKEMKFPIDVSRVRADANVFYRNKQLGRLDLRKWQRSNSSRLEARDGDKATLLVESLVKDAPLEITDSDAFSKVVQALIFGGRPVSLGIKADVDVDVSTPLGKFVLKDIPAEGAIAIEPFGGRLDSFTFQVGSFKIVDTTKRSLTLEAMANFTNPTEYSASIPFMDIKLFGNGTEVGHAIMRNVTVVPGRNDNVVARVLWDPWTPSGKEGRALGRELLSRYISGWNVTLTARTYEGSIPSQPELGKALSSLKIEMPMPKMTMPGHGDGDSGEPGDGPHFIGDTTMHLLTSTATFTLYSPFPDSTMYITHMDATAFYNHTDPVGHILYKVPFAVPPGASQTPRLPVDWISASLGFEALRSALGGHLKLDAKAIVGVRIDNFVETIWFIGRGIGAKIRL